VLLNKIVILFFILLPLKTFSMSCDLAKAVNHPLLAQNSEFWSKLSTLNPKDDFAIKNLINQFAPEALGIAQSAPSATLKAWSFVEVSHKVEKAVAKLSKINIKHYDDFIKILNEKGVQGFYENPGKWHYEKLAEYGPNAHSVRLDSGVRVLLDVGKNGSTVVRDVSNKIGH
jgi:hypothetical protein